MRYTPESYAVRFLSQGATLEAVTEAAGLRISRNLFDARLVNLALAYRANGAKKAVSFYSWLRVEVTE